MLIPVKLESRSYTIVVEPGALSKIGEYLRPLGLGTKVCIISDSGIRARYGATMTESLRTAGFAVLEMDVPEGEAAKTLATASACWDRLLDHGFDRTSTVIALGGGAIGDLAGFVAATYMRGMHVVQVPTTVLAQVDASIGGKTAVDHPRAKNLIGAFHQPRLVLVDPLTVRSLPEREYRSGLAEMVKHGIVLDRDYFDDMERSTRALLAREPAALERLIGGSCQLKASVVERDEREAELRAVLNYGHTIGHALEAVTGYGRWTHGEAVSLGIVSEARLAARLGLAEEHTVSRQRTLLAGLGLPTKIDHIDADAVIDAIRRDKKGRDGRVPFVLAPAIGQFRLVSDVSDADVRAALDVA
jgi:3-dehydroquinate synthase